MKILNCVELKSKFKTSTFKYFIEAYFNAFVKFLEILPPEILYEYHESFQRKYINSDWINNIREGSSSAEYINKYEKYPDEFFKF